MESLQNAIDLQKRRMAIYDIEKDNEKEDNTTLEDIQRQLEVLQDNQKGLLSIQEQVYYKSLSDSEMLDIVLSNQVEMKQNINKILELLG